VVGVNDDRYDAEAMHIVSAASCTTNCLAPMVKVLHEHFGVVGGLVTTIHAFTRDQEIHDTIHEDPRRGRAASLNMTPTKDRRGQGDRRGAARTRRPAGRHRRPRPGARRVPDRPVGRPRAGHHGRGDQRRLPHAAADAHWHGVLAASDEPLVSSDYVGDHHSCTVDLVSIVAGRRPSGPDGGSMDDQTFASRSAALLA